MSVLSHREVLPRTFNHKFGEAPTAERKFVVSLSEPVPTQSILDQVGIFHGAPHPEYSYLFCVEGSVNEIDRHYAECTYRYALPSIDVDDNAGGGGGGGLSVSPLARRDVWTFSVGGAQVPALTYYHGDGNSDVRPLVNAAGDFFEGLMVNEAEVRATISSNRPIFDLPMAANVTNGINASPYLGGDSYTWLCAGIGAQQTSELVGSITVRYWQLTVELIYRRSGWIMLLPHVGLHYVYPPGSDIKSRAWVYSDTGTGDPGDPVPAAAPQPLTETGDLKYPGRYGLPDILRRRVNPVIDFPTFFGTPPF